jgi:ParB family chromosome partitioning protein
MLVESLKISTGHAKVLLGLSRTDLQLKLVKRILDGQLSVRQAELLVTSELRAGKTRTASRRASAFPDLEEKMRKRLGTKVTITRGRKGGRIEIHYFEPADLDRLTEMILG